MQNMNAKMANKGSVQMRETNCLQNWDNFPRSSYVWDVLLVGTALKKNHTKQLAELIPNIEWWKDPILRVLPLIRVVLLACMSVAF